jgi:hypothetical protein
MNENILNGFIGEKGGKGQNISNHMHLEFTKAPTKTEAEAWEHRTRFRSVLVKAAVEIDSEEVRVIYVDSVDVKNDILSVKGSKQEGWKYTLYCLPSELKVSYEVYEGAPFERLGTGLVKYASKEQIEKKIGHHDWVSWGKDKMEATFKEDPVKTGTVNSVVFEDDVLVYSKNTKGALEIDAHATENQIKTYTNL